MFDANRQKRVPPIKLLGVRRALASLGYGAVMGVTTGFIVSLTFSPFATTGTLRAGLVFMGVIFGLLFGPMLTLLMALMLAEAGFSYPDFITVGWSKLILFAVFGLPTGMGCGIVASFIWIQMIPAGDAVVFMGAVVGGLIGMLVPPSVLVAQAAKRRVATHGLPVATQ